MSAPNPDSMMFIRHAEKPGEHGAPHGVNPHGEQDPHSLSVRGWTRAGALAALFGQAPHANRAGIVRPARVFATRPNGHAKSRRELDTATPTAQRIGVEVDDRYDHSDSDELVNALLGSGDPALVVWHHGAMRELLDRLPVANRDDIPDEWPDERFDLVWVLSWSGDAYTFTQVAQDLLDGDLAN